MLSIKNSLCSALLLATYATAAKPGQSAINLSVEYCSDENTGSENDKGSNIYQTLGLCNDSCQGKFKYAVLQYQECWCSNEKPDKTVDLEKCNQSCPGYPEQKCGNKGAGMYAYVPLDGAPFGDEPSTTSPSGPASTSSNSTVPAMTPSSSAGTNSTSSSGSSGSAGGENSNSNSNSTSSSDDADAAFEGDANGLSVPRNTLAMGAVLGLLATCAFGITA